jgi:hypothetical protein
MKPICRLLGVFGAVIAVTSSVAALAPVPAALAHGGDPGAAMMYSPIVQGKVTQKFAPHGGKEGDSDCLVLIDGAPYMLSRDMYREIEVGAVLRFDGVSWTILSNGA